MAEWLLDGSCVDPDMERVLSQLPRNTRQVLIRPCKDVPILTEEVDELAFLFVLQPGTDNDGVVRERLIDVDLLGLFGGLECRGRL